MSVGLLTAVVLSSLATGTSPLSGAPLLTTGAVVADSQSTDGELYHARFNASRLLKRAGDEWMPMRQSREYAELPAGPLQFELSIYAPLEEAQFVHWLSLADSERQVVFATADLATGTVVATFIFRPFEVYRLSPSPNGSDYGVLRLPVATDRPREVSKRAPGRSQLERKHNQFMRLADLHRGQEFRVSLRESSGTPAMITGDLGNLPGGSPETLAQQLLEDPVFMATGAETLLPVVSRLQHGWITHVFSQQIDGIQVRGAGLLVDASADTGKIRSVSGHFLPADMAPPASTAMSRQRAVEQITEHVRQIGAKPARVVDAEIELQYTIRGDGPRLYWVGYLYGAYGEVVLPVEIDAESGRVHATVPAAHLNGKAINSGPSTRSAPLLGHDAPPSSTTESVAAAISFESVDESLVAASVVARVQNRPETGAYRFVTVDEQYLRALIRDPIGRPIRIELFAGEVVEATPRERLEYFKGQRKGIATWSGRSADGGSVHLMAGLSGTRGRMMLDDTVYVIEPTDQPGGVHVIRRLNSNGIRYKF